MKFVTVRECAKVTGLHPNTISNMMKDGRIKYIEVPGSRFRKIPESELKRLINMMWPQGQQMELW